MLYFSFFFPFGAKVIAIHVTAKATKLRLIKTGFDLMRMRPNRLLKKGDGNLIVQFIDAHLVLSWPAGSSDHRTLPVM